VRKEENIEAVAQEENLTIDKDTCRLLESFQTPQTSSTPKAKSPKADTKTIEKVKSTHVIKSSNSSKYQRNNPG
jgi:hypothetical protein